MAKKGVNWVLPNADTYKGIAKSLVWYLAVDFGFALKYFGVYVIHPSI